VVKISFASVVEGCWKVNNMHYMCHMLGCALQNCFWCKSCNKGTCRQDMAMFLMCWVCVCVGGGRRKTRQLALYRDHVCCTWVGVHPIGLGVCTCVGAVPREMHYSDYAQPSLGRHSLKLLGVPVLHQLARRLQQGVPLVGIGMCLLAGCVPWAIQGTAQTRLGGTCGVFVSNATGRKAKSATCKAPASWVRCGCGAREGVAAKSVGQCAAGFGSSE
jgi:hypothetical protein